MPLADQRTRLGGFCFLRQSVNRRPVLLRGPRAPRLSTASTAEPVFDSRGISDTAPKSCPRSPVAPEALLSCGLSAAGRRRCEEADAERWARQFHAVARDMI